MRKRTLKYVVAYCRLCPFHLVQPNKVGYTLACKATDKKIQLVDTNGWQKDFPDHCPLGTRIIVVAIKRQVEKEYAST